MSLHRKARLKNKETCKYCGSWTHLSLNCYRRPRSPLLRESKSAKFKRIMVANAWFHMNPPDENGYWLCYLQITKDCPKLLDRSTVMLEHVFPKAKYPELKYKVENIKPSCEFCNKEKGRNTIDQLALIFPRIVDMIAQPEWLAWEEALMQYVKPELH